MQTVALFAVLCVIAAVSANPAANTEWRWKSRMPTVSSNPRALPFQGFMKNVVKQPRVPGTKLVAGCGPTKMSSTRIVGGNEAVPNSYPWQVALFIDDSYFCGGSIINEEYILTAGHCLDGAVSVGVVAGAHDIRENEPSQVTIVSTDLTVHSGYNSLLLRNDIAYVRLPTPLTFTAEIAPICLPGYGTPELSVGETVNPSGWGKRSDNALGISDVLYETTNTIISQSDCSDVYGTAIITDSIVCTDTTGGHGTCNGDSGGPLNYVDGGVTYTRGVTSFVSSAGCESGLPDGFTRVTSFLDWIESETGIAIDS